ncbi:MAG TPA: DUF72 domain-containing protein [Zeimonas sp.]|nr:DUF72 domain-containing protein [Zeimonas sp.]
MGRIRIGISGWTYAPWRGVFYPEGLKHDEELAYAASRFDSIEINSTFYRLQQPASFARWRDETPEDFVFSVKAPRYITHVRRLREVETPIANFLASGVLLLGEKLGPLLWQFPPFLRYDPERFEAFFAQLPHDTERAAAVARAHDERIRGDEGIAKGPARPLRHAIEVRHESFRDPAFIESLRRHRVALVCADTVSWPRLMDLTADFVYCRLHGSEELYVSGYDDASLDAWAMRVIAWAEGREPEDAERVLPALETPPPPEGRDVFVYFDNDAKVRAPADAASLAARVSGSRTTKAPVR